MPMPSFPNRILKLRTLFTLPMHKDELATIITDNTIKSLPTPLTLPMHKDELATVQGLIGYEFRDPCLLEAALIHSSYSYRCRFSKDLKKIGQQALHSSVTRYLNSYAAQNYKETYGSEDFKRLWVANLSIQKLACSAVRLGLYPFLRHNSLQLDLEVEEFTEANKGNPQLVAGGLFFPIAPKALAEIVQAIAGAITEDWGNYEIPTIDRLLEPFITGDDMNDAESVLRGLCKKHEMSYEIKKYYKNVKKWRRSEGALVYVYKVFINGKLLGSSSSNEDYVARIVATTEALWKLPMFMGKEGESKNKFVEYESPIEDSYEDE